MISAAAWRRPQQFDWFRDFHCRQEPRKDDGAAARQTGRSATKQPANSTGANSHGSNGNLRPQHRRHDTAGELQEMARGLIEEARCPLPQSVFSGETGGVPTTARAEANSQNCRKRASAAIGPPRAGRPDPVMKPSRSPSPGGCPHQHGAERKTDTETGKRRRGQRLVAPA